MFDIWADDVKQTLLEAVDISRELFADCDPNLADDFLKILPGNYAGYGAYAAIAHSAIGAVEIPLGNQSSPLTLTSAGVSFRSGNRDFRKVLLGLAIHELGHVAVATSRVQPWADWEGGDSTHSSAAWCWVTTQGWRWHHGWEGDPEQLGRYAATAAHYDGGPDYGAEGTVASILSSWSPFMDPMSLDSRHWSKVAPPKAKACQHCHKPVDEWDAPADFRRDAMRRDAKFCSSTCRVAAHRKAKTSKTAEPKSESCA